MGRIIGLDVGEARIGVAVSDPMGIIAQPHKVIPGTKKNESMNGILELFKEFDISTLVIGIPKNLHGNLSKQGESIKKWVEKLQKKIPVCNIEFWDERHTSKQAHRVLSEGTKKSRREKGNVDMLSAVFILQSYLDNKSDKEN